VANSIGAALSDAERTAFTRPIPKSTEAQFRFLERQAKGETKTLAAMLGKSVRQVQRYRSGRARLPAQAVRKAILERWQPRVRARARQQMAQQGAIIDLRARFGYTASPGSTDDARIRHLTQPLPPDYMQRLLDARTETERRQILAQGLGEMYFRDRGARAHDLDVHLTDIDFITIHPYT
jgi:hypothetical protein